MRKFVTDHAAGCAVIDRRIGIGIKNGRLENSGWKHNVAQTAVVSVVSLWRHTPIASVNGSREATGIEIPIELRAALHVANQIVTANDKLRIIARMIRITDFNGVSVEFLERFLLCLRPHPIKLFDSRAIGCLQICNEILNFCFRFRRKIFCGVKLADAESHRAEGSKAIADSEVAAADGCDPALPTCLLLLLPGKCFGVELEISVGERL